MKSILVVDDNPDVRMQVTDILREAGYIADEAINGKEAVEKTFKNDYDIVILDSIMPVMKGADAISEIRKHRPKTKVIVITAFATIEDAVESIKKGAVDYVSKPFKIEQLLTIIRREIEESTFDTESQNMDLDYVFATLSNPIRRKIIKLLSTRISMRFMELNRELNLEDHTKLVFHLKMLKESGIILQQNDKAYSLTNEGMKVIKSLAILEEYLCAKACEV